MVRETSRRCRRPCSGAPRRSSRWCRRGRCWSPPCGRRRSRRRRSPTGCRTPRSRARRRLPSRSAWCRSSSGPTPTLTLPSPARSAPPHEAARERALEHVARAVRVAGRQVARLRGEEHGLTGELAAALLAPAAAARARERDLELEPFPGVPSCAADARNVSPARPCCRCGCRACARRPASRRRRAAPVTALCHAGFPVPLSARLVASETNATRSQWPSTLTS